MIPLLFLESNMVFTAVPYAFDGGLANRFVLLFFALEEMEIDWLGSQKHEPAWEIVLRFSDC